ncbi:MAG: hypothetical protein IT452_09715 [Planctomycetia bacterium]|nr:hypothetical protein [Planctomycetia bacterium]
METTRDPGRLLARIEREAGVPGLASILVDRLSPTDLQSLMLLPESGAPVEVGDGGFNDWTARLLGNAKERLLCGCIAGERVLQAARQ